MKATIQRLRTWYNTPIKVVYSHHGIATIILLAIFGGGLILFITLTQVSTDVSGLKAPSTGTKYVPLEPTTLKQLGTTVKADVSDLRSMLLAILCTVLFIFASFFAASTWFKHALKQHEQQNLKNGNN